MYKKNYCTVAYRGVGGGNVGITLPSAANYILTYFSLPGGGGKLKHLKQDTMSPLAKILSTPLSMY